MNKTNNPYVATLLQSGYDLADCQTPAPKAEYPRTIYGRTFATKAEYNEAMADFLNGL